LAELPIYYLNNLSALQALLDGDGDFGFGAVCGQVYHGGLDPRDQRPDNSHPKKNVVLLHRKRQPVEGQK